MSDQPNSVLSFEEARACVEKHARNLSAQISRAVPLLDSIGRALAEDITADRDFPPFSRATRDGFALRAADLTTLPATLKVIGQVKAGSPTPTFGPIQSGTCAEIMTGAAVPAGADAIVMMEYTIRLSDDSVQINRAVKNGENIVPAGSEARAGEILLKCGSRIGYPQIAVAASVGKSKLDVYAKPRIAILSTGDEVVDIADSPGPHQIRNSNSYSLAAQVLAAGASPEQLPIAPDESAKLRELIQRGFDSDLLLISGGVSMGKFDLVEQVLRDFNAEIFFTGALIQPGKPIVFGRIIRDNQSKYFLGLPGNPISTMVTFELFARPLMDALSGASPSPLLFAKARLKADLRPRPGLTRFLPAVLAGNHAIPEVELVGWQGSGDIVSMARANSFVVVPPDREHIAAGEDVSILQL
ncbi:MAG: molybdopterin molybdochelatase [Acidobacteriales bacterium]|nr:molybdopterin molybdochelatase [Terriglobales bacterium]